MDVAVERLEAEAVLVAHGTRRQRLGHEGNLEQPTEYSFIPHITIGQRLSDDEHLDVYSQLKLVDVAHEETVDRFHLMYQLENETWTVFETFRLGKG